VTIRKELGTFSAMWTWANRQNLLKGTIPNRGLVYPKQDERTVFQTFDEITDQLQGEVLSKRNLAKIWDCLFLTSAEVADLLKVVKERAHYPWIYPMFVFAAHTGARRSEILRAKITDFKFKAGVVVIRERKRDKTRHTTRRVPLTPLLEQVMREWFAKHPGGEFVICHESRVRRGNYVAGYRRPVSPASAAKYFKRTLRGTKWQVARGWHVLRHSFASNCAAQGIDQRVIDSWLGHQTEEMARRYRHLIPNQQAQALKSVFEESLG